MPSEGLQFQVLESEEEQVTNSNWQEFANCLGVDPEIFFPTEDDPAIAAKAICKACDVQVICLDYALTKPEKIGVWGGQTEKERRSMLRRSRKAAT